MEDLQGPSLQVFYCDFRTEIDIVIPLDYDGAHVRIPMGRRGPG